LHQLLPKIFQGELIFLELAGHFFRLLEISFCLGFFYKTQDVSHTEDARSHSVWMKNLQFIELLSDADEFYRTMSNKGDRQGCSAPSIAIHLGQNNRCQPDFFLKSLSAPDSILTGHGITDINHLSGLKNILSQTKLGH